MAVGQSANFGGYLIWRMADFVKFGGDLIWRMADFVKFGGLENFRQLQVENFNAFNSKNFILKRFC